MQPYNGESQQHFAARQRVAYQRDQLNIALEAVDEIERWEHTPERDIAGMRILDREARRAEARGIAITAHQATQDKPEVEKGATAPSGPADSHIAPGEVGTWRI